MDTRKTSLILIALVVAMLTITLTVVPVSAVTPINVMTDSCNCDCDCNAIDIQSSTLACCSISDKSFCGCILSNVPDSDAMLPGYTTLNLDVNNGQYVQGVSTEIDSNSKQLIEQESPQLLPAYLCSEYHCRNSLNSEARPS